jgi:hypothetical protein
MAFLVDTTLEYRGCPKRVAFLFCICIGEDCGLLVKIVNKIGAIFDQ